MDLEQYEASLAELDPITQARLRHGMWLLDEAMGLYKRDWFPTTTLQELVGGLGSGGLRGLRTVRYWDFASTDPNRRGQGQGQGQNRGQGRREPDWSVGVLLGEHRGVYTVLDVTRRRVAPEALETLVHATAAQDAAIYGYGRTQIFIEEEPGSSGKIVTDHYARNVLKGFPVYSNRETGSKTLRSSPCSAAASRGNIRLIRAPWNTDFLEELTIFPHGQHDDQADALSGAFRMLQKRPNLLALPTEVGDEGPSYWRAL